MRHTKLLVLAATVLSPALAAAQGVLGPQGTYYLTSFSGPSNWMLHGTTATPFARAGSPEGEGAIAVSGDVRTLAQGNVALGPLPGSHVGAQYSLGGTATGTSYAYPLGTGIGVYDGTTDGTFNYAVSAQTNDVYRFDRNWANPFLLFNTAATTAAMDFPVGVTYDPSRNSLWISNYTNAGATTIANFGFDGTFLGGFTVAVPLVAALAMDYTDGTLWFTSETTQGQFYNYATDGTFIGKATYGNVQNASLGGEFNLAAVPEPGTYALLATGLLGVAAAARRRRVAA